MGNLYEQERMKRIERNSKILKEAEQDQPLKKTTIANGTGSMKIKDKNKKSYQAFNVRL